MCCACTQKRSFTRVVIMHGLTLCFWSDMPWTFFISVSEDLLKWPSSVPWDSHSKLPTTHFRLGIQVLCAVSRPRLAGEGWLPLVSHMRDKRQAWQCPGWWWSRGWWGEFLEVKENPLQKAVSVSAELISQKVHPFNLSWSEGHSPCKLALVS